MEKFLTQSAGNFPELGLSTPAVFFIKGFLELEIIHFMNLLSYIAY